MDRGYPAREQLTEIKLMIGVLMALLLTTIVAL